MGVNRRSSKGSSELVYLLIRAILILLHIMITVAAVAKDSILKLYLKSPGMALKHIIAFLM